MDWRKKTAITIDVSAYTSSVIFCFSLKYHIGLQYKYTNCLVTIQIENYCLFHVVFVGNRLSSVVLSIYKKSLY